MKIHEAITMLEQMDPTKECTVTFGQPKNSLEYPGVPYQHYAPLWAKQNPSGTPLNTSYGH